MNMCGSVFSLPLPGLSECIILWPARQGIVE